LKDSKKVGIFGGTFNPVHCGHLINAEIIREKFSLDKILFVPSKSPVHKEQIDHVSAEDRFRMLEIAIKGNSKFEISRIEIERDEDSYTIFTVQELLKRFTDTEFSLIIGHDSYSQLTTWRDYQNLIGSVRIIVMKRAWDDAVHPEINRMARKIDFAENPVIEISATDIRERIKNGRSVQYHLPDSVIEYIHQKRLYRN